MAIEKFVDELGSNLNRYRVQKENGETYYISLMRNATITQPGTPLNANKLNKIVDSINNLSFSVSGNSLNITNQNGENIVFNNTNTTYTLTKSGATFTFASSTGSSNSYTITKSDIGLGNVDNTKDSEKIVAQANKLSTLCFFKISDYNGKNSTNTYGFDGQVGFNYILPNSLYLNNLYIANASNDEEYALFRYSNSNKRLEVHSQGAIIFISGSYIANVPNNKSGTLLVDSDLQGVKNSIDTEISNIKNRLDQMGFSEGTFEVSGVSSDRITTNKIVKKGKYAIGNLSINLYNQSLSNLSIMLPREFTPLNSTQVMLGYTTTLSSFCMYTTMQDGIDLTEFKKLKNVVSLSIVNLGWEIE